MDFSKRRGTLLILHKVERSEDTKMSFEYEYRKSKRNHRRMPKSLQNLSGVKVRRSKKFSKLLLCIEKNKLCFVRIN